MDRLEQAPGARRLSELASEITDMSLQGMLVRFWNRFIRRVVATPEGAHKIGLCPRCFAPAKKLAEKVELASGQFQDRTAKGSSLLPHVQGQPVVLQDALFLQDRTVRAGLDGSGRQLPVPPTAGAPHHRLYLEQDRPRAEGFQQVVIRTAIKRRDHVRLFNTVCEHHNVGGTEFTDSPENLKPIDIGKSNINGHDSGSFNPDGFNPFKTSSGGMNHETSPNQHGRQLIPHVIVSIYYYRHT